MDFAIHESALGLYMHCIILYGIVSLTFRVVKHMMTCATGTATYRPRVECVEMECVLVAVTLAGITAMAVRPDFLAFISWHSYLITSLESQLAHLFKQSLVIFDLYVEQPAAKLWRRSARVSRAISAPYLPRHS